MFENLDDILLQVELRVLHGLGKHLDQQLDGEHGVSAIRGFAEAYVGYAHARPKLWCLLHEHQLSDGRQLPTWYTEALHAPVERLQAFLAKALGISEHAALRRTACNLWQMIHGVTLVTTSSKLGPVEKAAAQSQVVELVESCLTGLMYSKASADKAPARRARSG